MLHNLPPLPPIKNEETSEPWESVPFNAVQGKSIGDIVIGPESQVYHF